MVDYKFNEDFNKRLVKGIEQGYSGYAEVRREKRKELLVSGAYAWVKGNHIEDQVARELQEIGIEFKEEKAGFAWEYLSFTNPKENYLFLIKNANIVKHKSNIPTLDTPSSDNYLVGLSKINSTVDFGEIKGSHQGTLELLDLQTLPKSIEDESIEELKKQYTHFYILTYTIDATSRMLSSVDLWMPEFIVNSKVEMVKVDSLTRHLGNTDAEVNFEAIQELLNLPEEEFSGTPIEFEYKTIEETETETEREKA